MSDESDDKDLRGVEGEIPTPDEAEDERLRALVKKAVKKASSEPPAPLVDDPEASASLADAEDFDASMLDEVDLKDALRGALRPSKGAVAPSLLKGVQRKLRVRSRGKFYGDGWSTSESPKTTYLVTSLIMLVLVVLVFFALVPWSSATLP